VKHNILLVDDEPSILKALKRLFSDTDYKIFTATSGDQGLELCEKEEFALVMSDYRMPHMTGVEFLAKVKEKYLDTIRIVLSGYADVVAIVEAINDGQVYKFLSKPWNDQDLLTTVQRSLEHYDLQAENLDLLNELKTANSGLRELTEGLEAKVEERTQDLGLKNRALIVTQQLLNLLPIGVIGIDSDGTLVYTNDAIGRHIDISHFALGEQIDDSLFAGPLSHLKEALEHNQVVYKTDQQQEGLRIICSPLANNAGVVGLYSFVDLARYSRKSVEQSNKVEAVDVTRD